MGAEDDYDDFHTILYDVSAVLFLTTCPLFTYAGNRFLGFLLVIALGLMGEIVGSIFADQEEISSMYTAITVSVCAVLGVLLAIFQQHWATCTYGGFFGILLGDILYDLVMAFIELDYWYISLAFLGGGFLFGFLLAYFAEGRLWLVPLMTSFAGGYYGCAALDWIGYRWEYSDMDVFWPTNFMSLDKGYADCTSGWCIFCAILWPLLTISGFYVQYKILGPGKYDSVHKSASEEEQYPLLDDGAPPEATPEQRQNIALLRMKLEQQQAARQKDKVELKNLKKQMKAALKGGPNPGEDEEAGDGTKKKKGGFLSRLFCRAGTPTQK